MDWSGLSLRRAAEHIRFGDVTAERYAETLLAACAVGASLNAFITLDPDGVRRAARAADIRRGNGEALGPLHGIPLAIKDVFDIAGTPTTAGTPALRSNIARTSAPLVGSLFTAGAVLLGKTNMHELAFGITNSNEFTGAVHNPYDQARSPGGSSGGTAAAVAARMAPAGLGTDTSGSIRIPAAHCGVFGYRPSTGRYSAAGVVPMNHTRDTPGLMARSVDDIALLDQAVTGARDLLAVELRGLRLGLPDGDFLTGLDDRIAAAFAAEIDRLTRLGVACVSIRLPELRALCAEATGPIMAWELPRDLTRYLEDAGLSLRIADLVAAVASPYVKSELEAVLAERPDLERDYRLAISEILPRLRSAYRTCLSDNGLHAVAFPTTPMLPPPLGQHDTVVLNGSSVSIWHNLHNAVPATLLGAPCLSLPVSMSPEGLPIGLELDGWPGRDRDLLAIGRAWERAAPRLPPPSLPAHPAAPERTAAQALTAA